MRLRTFAITGLVSCFGVFLSLLIDHFTGNSFSLTSGETTLLVILFWILINQYLEEAK